MDILDLFLDYLKNFRMRLTLNMVTAHLGILRNFGLRILIKSLIILVNLILCVKVILGTLLDSLWVSNLVLFLWEHVTHSLTLKGFDVLSLKVFAKGVL